MVLIFREYFNFFKTIFYEIAKRVILFIIFNKKYQKAVLHGRTDQGAHIPADGFNSM